MDLDYPSLALNGKYKSLYCLLCDLPHIQLRNLTNFGISIRRFGGVVNAMPC